MLAARCLHSQQASSQQPRRALASLLPSPEELHSNAGLPEFTLIPQQPQLPYTPVLFSLKLHYKI